MLTTLNSILPLTEQRVILRAALLAHNGKHAEAEAVRFAAGYHDQKEDQCSSSS